MQVMPAASQEALFYHDQLGLNFSSLGLRSLTYLELCVIPSLVRPYVLLPSLS